jgi:hypothetical protein
MRFHHDIPIPYLSPWASYDIALVHISTLITRLNAAIQRASPARDAHTLNVLIGATTIAARASADLAMTREIGETYGRLVSSPYDAYWGLSLMTTLGRIGDEVEQATRGVEGLVDGL